MSIWFVLAALAAALSILLVLDAAARWSQSTGIVLAEYDRMLKCSRDRSEANESAPARPPPAAVQPAEPESTDDD